MAETIARPYSYQARLVLDGGESAVKETLVKVRGGRSLITGRTEKTKRFRPAHLGRHGKEVDIAKNGLPAGGKLIRSRGNSPGVWGKKEGS